MKISIIVAASTNNVIGRDGGLPWRIPDDLKRFKALTMGKPIVMGRVTHESIGRPLPGRQNIVLSSLAAYRAHGCDVAATPAKALLQAEGADEVMIIGGGKVYEQFLPRAARIYLTRVHATLDGDTFFPAIEPSEWRLELCEDHPANSKSGFPFSFEVLQRR